MLIGICGRARSGKDTFAKMLGEALFDATGQRYVLMAYGNELKLRVQRDFDLSFDQLWGDDKELEDKRYPKKDGGFWSGREILQFMGTECFRAVDNNFWVKQLFDKIDEKEYENVIITDVRFPNEADPVVDKKGFVIKIVRSDRQSIHGTTHASETSMDNYERSEIIEIINDGDLNDLRVAANQLVKSILEGKTNTVNI